MGITFADTAYEKSSPSAVARRWSFAASILSLAVPDHLLQASPMGRDPELSLEAMSIAYRVAKDCPLFQSKRLRTLHASSPAELQAVGAAEASSPRHSMSLNACRLSLGLSLVPDLFTTFCIFHFPPLSICLGFHKLQSRNQRRLMRDSSWQDALSSKSSTSWPRIRVPTSLLCSLCI